ncbi:phosphatase PAP2 family protein [Chlorobium phaeovibrioides]|uniref:phosphatase PAP2 family protein n=1 Tax=Chlorobium phaeovibrioides TaxID=1094 RepID=UPI00123136C7|nr:phosphatase PAP2 family protein [Chlorobium phaeovibrioides]QEQ57258.1 phosphatase PAP2 family protein [Chlorobium phaeovibrioides]
MKKIHFRCLAAMWLLLAGLSGRSGPAYAADGIETAGTALAAALPAAAGGLCLLHEDREGAVQLLESAALTLGVTYAMKYAIDEDRPDGGKRSFPSGHTSVSFSAAEFMRSRYGWNYALPAYALAGFVGYSRIEADRHHMHDVLAGAAVGVFSSMLFTTPRNGLLVSATAGDGGYALHLTLTL